MSYRQLVEQERIRKIVDREVAAGRALPSNGGKSQVGGPRVIPSTQKQNQVIARMTRESF